MTAGRENDPVVWGWDFNQELRSLKFSACSAEGRDELLEVFERLDLELLTKNWRHLIPELDSIDTPHSLSRLDDVGRTGFTASWLETSHAITPSMGSRKFDLRVGLSREA